VSWPHFGPTTLLSFFGASYLFIKDITILSVCAYNMKQTTLHYTNFFFLNFLFDALLEHLMKEIARLFVLASLFMQQTETDKQTLIL
jgi:hypothetical protein